MLTRLFKKNEFLTNSLLLFGSRRVRRGGGFRLGFFRLGFALGRLGLGGRRAFRSSCFGGGTAATSNSQSAHGDQSEQLGNRHNFRLLLPAHTGVGLERGDQTLDY